MKKMLNWLYQNSANILSASRNLTPIILFVLEGLSILERLIAVVILAATDFVDGWLARKIGSAGKIGEFIDHFSDKVMIFSVLAFLFSEKIINPKIIGAIISGEVLSSAIAIFRIYLLRNGDWIKWKKDILKNCKVNAPGKLAMVFYLSMAVFIFLAVIFPQNEIWVDLYFVSFSGGLFLRIFSIGYYIVDLNNWHREHNSSV